MSYYTRKNNNTTKEKSIKVESNKLAEKRKGPGDFFKASTSSKKSNPTVNYCF